MPHPEYHVPKICYSYTMPGMYSFFDLSRGFSVNLAKYTPALKKKKGNRVINSYIREPTNEDLGRIFLYLHCVPAFVTLLGGSLGSSADFSFVKFVDGLHLGERSSSSSADQTLSGEEIICCEVRKGRGMDSWKGNWT